MRIECDWNYDTMSIWEETGRCHKVRRWLCLVWSAQKKGEEEMKAGWVFDGNGVTTADFGCGTFRYRS